MKLTPLDIRHKEFKRGLRGYVDGEVDEFLDEVADEFERLFKENIELGEQVDSLEERVDQYRNLEETLQKTLVSAQKSAEELKVNAEKEAQLILREAEMKAREMVNDSYADKQGVEKAIVVLKGTEEEFRFKFKALLQGYMKQVDELEERAKRARDEADERTRKARDEAQAAASPVAAPAPATVETEIEAPASEPPDEAERAAAAAAQETPAATPPPIPEPRVGSARPAEPDRSPTSGGVFAGPPTEPEAPAPGAPSDEDMPIPSADDLLGDVESEVGDDEFKW
jgi:cell division initiation protein